MAWIMALIWAACCAGAAAAAMRKWVQPEREVSRRRWTAILAAAALGGAAAGWFTGNAGMILSYEVRCLAALALVGCVWTPYSPTAMSGSEKFLAPCLRHLFGTDNFGRDIFSRVLAGAGTTFFISAATVCIGAAAGTLVGAFTGYFGGWLDEALMRVNDAVTAFPSILLALVFISLLGFGKYNVILALGVAFVPSYARVVRGEFARHREMNYVKSARLMGAGHLRIMFLHILPNTRQVLLPTLVIGFNNAVLAEASMSYLCIGVTPPDASLGYMLSESQGMFVSAPWYALGTGLTLVWMIFGVALIGEGLQRRNGGDV